MPETQNGRAQARFVFLGTVRRLGAATMDRVPDKSNAIVVRVDDIKRGPDVGNDFKGREITVQTSGDRQFRLRQSGTFYTNISILGESLAVRLVDFDAADAAAPAVSAELAAPADPAKTLEREDITRRVEGAALVVSGKVMAVHAVESGAPPGVAAAAAGTDEGSASEPISEHAPLWREATVQVDTVLKPPREGEPATRQTVKVRFPASTDIRWYKAPKLNPGQEGVFILHSGEGTDAARGAVAGAAAAAPADDATVFTVLQPHDFQAADKFDEISHIASLTRGDRDR